jgi:hypothetical protein
MNPFANIRHHHRVISLMLLLVVSTCSARAVTEGELRADPALTPESLLQRFANFKFRLFDEVQPRDTFLATQTGDCDDFATLAADVLHERGYSTHLIAVFMEKQVHVVCYVKEIGAYLDYNNRKKPAPLVPTNGSLSDIATKVARTFHAPWVTALEYTFKEGIKRTVAADFAQPAG